MKKYYVYFYHNGFDTQVWVEDKFGGIVTWDVNGVHVDYDSPRGNAYNGSNTEVFACSTIEEVETYLAWIDAQIRQWQKEDRDMISEELWNERIA